MKNFFSFLTGLLLFTSCQKQVVDQQPAEERIILDTAYAAASGRQTLDLYLPANRNSNTRTIVLIHGGGWSEGSKNDLTFAIPELRQRLTEYAFANIGYRLASNGNTHLFPTQEQDVKSAVDFIVANHASLNISSKVVLTGFSAGGHLALLHGYKNDPNKHVAAIVDFFGPTDLEALWNAGLIQQLILAGATGKIYPDGKTLYQESSPTNYITAQSPPTIVLHGGDDLLVPPAQSTLLINKLEEKNVVNDLVFYPGEGHGWTGDKLNDSIEKIKAFLKAYAK
ncbi:MAG: alpha/beta hydrolase [Chitinophagaceae bacterium]|nr:alpha/beta hydrolase [Chitinophagaceae bacterium]MCW5925377.1 alpha/beta hydrolase [Chitinophagaceae bacterium]